MLKTEVNKYICSLQHLLNYNDQILEGQVYKRHNTS